MENRDLISMHPAYPFVPLALPNSSKWLVSPSMTANSYSIYLTDLVTVYRESLADQEILERAQVSIVLHSFLSQDNESPIEPNTPAEFKSLLSRLHASLTKQDPTTILTLTKLKQQVLSLKTALLNRFP